MLGFLNHLFIPHSKNNHRAKILHNSTLLMLVFGLFALSFFGKVIALKYPEVLGISYSISEGELLAQVNQERQKNGLTTLNQNSELDAAAQKKAADMFAKNYWAHFAPDGSTSPWAFIKGEGYAYRYAGENLAKGFTDSNSVVNAWMNSPTHRENLLSGKYQDVGFAIVEGKLQGEDTVLIVQMFGTIPGEGAQPVEVSAASDNSPQAEVQGEGQEVAVKPQAVKSLIVSDQRVASPKIDTATTTKTLSIAILVFLLAGLVLDMMIVERNRIPRIVGHNLDHIMLIVLFVIFLIVLEGGVVI